MADGSTQRAARGTLFTIGLRLLSFVCTQATLKLLDAPSLGKASISLELLLTTVLFPAREGFRLAVTKQVDLSLAWWSAPVMSLVSLGAFLWWNASSTEDVDYQTAGLLYCLASWIEGVVEPWVLGALNDMNLTLKASAEGLGAFGKTIGTIFLVSLVPPVTAMGLGQVIYAVLYATVYISQSPMPTREVPKGETMYWTGIFTLQSIFKHVLTQGDRIVLTTLASHYEQGLYAIGHAYGSLAARLLLQPLEEHGRLVWSRMKNKAELRRSFVMGLRGVWYIGFLLACLAVNYTSILLKLVGKPEATEVLSAFCVYTAALAWNGLSEALVYAVASSGSDMGRLGIVHATIGGLLVASAPWAMTYGIVGLVAANGVAMCLRALYSMYCASVHLEEPMWKLLRDMLPHPTVLAAFGASFWMTLQSSQWLNAEGEWLKLAAKHIGVGLSCTIGIASLAYQNERELRRFLRPKQA